jgi:hypothetical protein
LASRGNPLRPRRRCRVRRQRLDATSLSNDPKKQPQSRYLRYDPATGKLSGASGTFLGIRRTYQRAVRLSG